VAGGEEPNEGFGELVVQDVAKWVRLPKLTYTTDLLEGDVGQRRALELEGRGHAEVLSTSTPARSQSAMLLATVRKKGCTRLTAVAVSLSVVGLSTAAARARRGRSRLQQTVYNGSLASR
jgi:hypothetical protein